MTSRVDGRHGSAAVDWGASAGQGSGAGRWPYPDVLLDEAAFEFNDWDRVGSYDGMVYSPRGDQDGWDALRFGAWYYEEGMSYDPVHNHDLRIGCFQMAELLYLHAAEFGNPIAHLNLGYVYSYDRCEGRYWDTNAVVDGPVSLDALCAALAGEGQDVRVQVGLGPDAGGAVEWDRKAFEHYRTAALAGVAEAWYKLGDLLRDGRGCDVDLRKAFGAFTSAYTYGKDQSPVIWGSAALRLGTAFEEGEGCDQSFAEARIWYERAVTGLGIAVRGGDSWYRGALRRAEQGLKRVKQELSGQY